MQKWEYKLILTFFSKRPNTKAAPRFFEHVTNETGVSPERVMTDKAKCYPPAVRALLADVEHRTSKYVDNGIERDHKHFKQRLYSMCGFKQVTSAGIMIRGHVLVRNLRNGFSTLTLHVPVNLRLTLYDRLAIVSTGNLNRSRLALK